MSTRLATPSFNGRATDQVEAVDIYGTVDPEVRNRFISEVSAFSRSLTEQFQSGQREIETVLNDIQNRRINLEDAQQRLNSVISGARQNIKDLSSSVQNRLLTAVGSDFGENIKVDINGTLRQIEGATRPAANAVLSMLRDATRSNVFKLIDQGANVGFLKVMLEEIGQWNIPDLLEETLKNFDPEVREEALRQSAPRLANTTDINSVERIINMGGGQALLASQPNFVGMLLQRYEIPEVTGSTTYAPQLAQLKRVLDALAPNWLNVTRGGHAVLNLEILQQANDDARKILATDPVVIVPALLAQFYPVRDFRSLATEMYPNIGFASQTV